jgi:hypothetical protein
MLKNLMLLFKFKLFTQKNMQFYLFSHIALFSGRLLNHDSFTRGDAVGLK